MCDNNKDIAVRTEDTRAVAPVSEKTITDYLAAFGLANQLTKQETSQFVEIAKAYSLNPFKREVYCVPHTGKDGKRSLSIITGYETYLKRAERTGLLDGWECTIEGEGQNMRAVATIQRKGWSRPFKHEVWLAEYDQQNRMWREKPRTMLKKVAIAQAFRLCFPEDMGGMPYTQDELPDEMTRALEARDVSPNCSEKPNSSPQLEPAAEAPKVKATPVQIKKMRALAEDFTETELAGFKEKYNGYPAEMIKAMTEARIAKFEAGTLRQDKTEPEPEPEKKKYPWATAEQAAELEKLAKESGAPDPAGETVGEPAPPLEFGEDDSKELYK